MHANVSLFVFAIIQALHPGHQYHRENEQALGYHHDGGQRGTRHEQGLLVVLLVDGEAWMEPILHRGPNQA